MDSLAATTLVGHRVRRTMGDREVDALRVVWAVDEGRSRGLPKTRSAILSCLSLLEPADAFDDLLRRAAYRKTTEKDIRAAIRRELERRDIREPEATVRAVMGRMRPLAWGNAPLGAVAGWVEEAAR